jgi:hypothetical protein
MVWKHPHLSPDDIYELVKIAHTETAHPRNLIKKRIIDRIKVLEAAGPPLFSERIDGLYTAHRNPPGAAGVAGEIAMQ